ncbi:MAG: class I SAM-dependent methyltransferase, partial [Pontimonas sp.]
NSSHEGKQWIIEQTKKHVEQYHQQIEFLDIGCGKGIYWEIINRKIHKGRWTAVEVWEPYIKQYRLYEKYDVIINEDVRTWEPGQEYTITYCGDVLEHMTRPEAEQVIQKLLPHTQTLFISIPIIHWPQHDHTNPYQNHIKDDWTHQEMIEMLTTLTKTTTPNATITHHTTPTIGVYQIKA